MSDVDLSAVICPKCAHQFHAISQSDQQRIAELEAEVIYHKRRHENEIMEIADTTLSCMSDAEVHRLMDRRGHYKAKEQNDE